MILRNIKHQENKVIESPRRSERRDYLSRVDFHNLCRYEQHRAGRSNASFQVISLRFSGPEVITQNRSALISVLNSRLRLIDEIGLLEQDQLGILVPYTSPQGARSLASEVLHLLPESISTPSVTILKNAVDGIDEQNKESEIVHNQELVPFSETAIDDVVTLSMPLWKRFADILGATIGIVCLSPFLLMIALFIKLSSKGPVIFAQQRTGRNGQPFWIYKFRSMVSNAEDFRDDLTSLNEQDGPAFKIHNDPRITWIGHWIRSLSLDELPQLWNVLKGDMSFVGPRPLPCHEADQCEVWQRQRATITPGITCVWQVQDRSASISFAEWMRMDIRYSRSISLKHDLKLIMQTFFFLVGRRNH